MIFSFFVDVQQLDPRSERYPVARNLVEIHQRQVRQPLLQLAQPDPDKILTLPRGRVVGIFAEIAESGGGLQRSGQFFAKFLFEDMDFFFQFFPWVI